MRDRREREKKREREREEKDIDIVGGGGGGQQVLDNLVSNKLTAVSQLEVQIMLRS